MKYSKQRELILNVVKMSMDHPSADMVYEIVKKELPKISLGTVYRNLNQLYELGLIKKIKMGSNRDRFDQTVAQHSHFYCDVCYQMFDIPPLGIEQMNHIIEKELGCLIEETDFVFTGICKNCH